jgi:8-oxo-dGTP diphosphatase
VQALIVDGDRVLLGLRGSEPGTGRWDIPGGFLHEGEDPLDGLRREVLEETGYRIEPLEFFGAWTEPYEGRLVLALTWTARIVGGEPRAGDDLVALRWFSRDELPAPDALAFVTFPEILERWRASAS